MKITSQQMLIKRNILNQLIITSTLKKKKNIELPKTAAVNQCYKIYSEA